MIYRVIGLMSGSSLDGLDIAFVHLDDSGGKWQYKIEHTSCVPYSQEMEAALKNAEHLSAKAYFLLHSSYGKFIGEAVNQFIQENGLWHQVQLIASHGHTTFHEPKLGYTGQLGCGATIAATTGINVVNELRVMDVALGGEGAPIVPMGEKLLLPGYAFYLNIGGIANISFNDTSGYVAFDICAASRILNMLVQPLGIPYDDGGKIAATGSVNVALLQALNKLSYYSEPYPKSLANNFGTAVVFPIIEQANLSVADALCTYIEHIAMQISYAIAHKASSEKQQILATGGGALNNFLIQRINYFIGAMNMQVVVADMQLLLYKEALIMALLGILRWREENTVLHSVTGASRSSIGGAVWIGQEA